MPINRSRFIFALSGQLTLTDWTAAGVTAVLRQAMRERRLRAPKLGTRLMAVQSDKPSFDQIVSFLMNDVGLTRAIARADATKSTGNFRRRTRNPQSVAQVPPTLAAASPEYAPLTRPSEWRIWSNRAIDNKFAGTHTPAGLQNLAIATLPNETDLARWLGVTTGQLRWIADTQGRNRKHQIRGVRTYRYRWIRRVSGFPRLLEIPQSRLKQIQKKILSDILTKIPVHPAAHGFTRGRSIVTNASAHCGKGIVLSFDLKDFFPAISSASVFRIFRSIGYSEEVSRLLSGLCTTCLPADIWDARPGARQGADFVIRQRLITRHLPQGAPTSPALANLAAHRLDRRLSGLARAANAQYTRYADDLTFSGGVELARSKKRLAAHIAYIAHDEGFLLNFRKSRMMRAGAQQRVTGVVVNVRPNITRSEFDALKATLTNCVRFGPSMQNRQQHDDFQGHLVGKVAHVANVNPVRGAKLRSLLHKIDWERSSS